MKLIVGLGNPGNEYKFTRHNAGFLVIDRICKKLNITLNKSKFNGEYAKVDELIVAKPLTYMNLSGNFIQQLSEFFKIDSSDILVIHDEKDIDLGKASIKVGGSAGSHNGIKSIVTQLGNKQDFKRMKIGIKKAFNGELKDFVLGKFTEEEILIIDKVIEKAADAAILYGFNDIYTVMNKFNTKKDLSE
ncbi:peptidyl-tRNA hydrolase [Mycoplasmopsis canis PG 14]|uniref:Peptidyl-tRNA hydrolase n=1 Tax=Mycoplasmopsis canis TaxID=29555 RepID=A0A449ARM4_9BACT|nr:aminoacyl-tRNA hydrolase [Mycoplasmopsis canis]AMD81593.1 peptidyl-tRNA hydrolase [Mycoplasmopsis canis PG 14]EIE41077.1 peptidyl-tRNA hydrolase [Mycoplasmopsis canis PG 14]VEU69225.1 Peptidyl-tRNA hydrolase [Mycoplasmopsis canis]